MRYKNIILGALLAASFGARGDNNLKFSEIWAKIRVHAPELQQKNQERQAAEAAAQAAKKHWLPRLSVGAQALNTDAPGNSLFLKLGQREIQAADFSPTELNDPDRETYIMSGAQLDWALYEGGRGQKGSEAGGKMAEAASQAEQAQSLFLYTTALRDYRDLTALYSQQASLSEVEQLVNQVLAKYQVGRKGNPVGYSGLLGLKGLRNRVVGLKQANGAESQGIKSNLSQKAGGLGDTWSPVAESVSSHSKGKDHVESSRVKAHQLQAQALGFQAQAQKSRVLPYVGARVNYERIEGDRGAGDALSGGVFLQWEIYSSNSRGAYRQAYHQAQASEAEARKMQIEETIQFEQVMSGLKATQENLRLLEESSALLKEQMQVSQKLFLNGSMNALQLTEVLSRRVDLLVDQTKARRQLHQLEGAHFMLTGGQLP
ncbi:MAG: TolC family protein [Bdellovibrionaceae bacterium]|nr:TolC family protein [Bdellovibrionales bacterium]MCB9083019.1 TolC family protein [Pseudobdellovibrionaceae bacterium]